MAATDWQLPFTVGRTFDVIASDPSTGVVIRRQRFPRPKPLREYVLEWPVMHQVELDEVVAVVDAARGGAMTFQLNLPKVGVQTVRVADDGYSFTVRRGKIRSMRISLVEEPRV